MKLLYTLLMTALTTSSVIAQISSATEKVLTKDRNAPMENTNVHTTSMGERQVFWSDDFSNPSNWLIQNTGDIPGVQGFVDLDWEIGVGLEPEGFVPIDPIASTTYDNGIAMVDSDQYGGEEGGAGVENCWFQTVNPIDCSEQETVALFFETFYWMWDGGSSNGNEYCLVEVSLDGTTWPDVTTFEVADATPGTRYELWPEMETQDPVDNPTTKFFDLTDIAAGEETVYLRFRWKGTWGYAWMVDDVVMQDLPENNLRINSNTYSDLTTAMVVEYGTYTPEQQATLSFRTDVENIGSADQLGVTMTVLVNGNAVGTTNPTDILVGETDSLIIGGYMVPDDPGLYNITYVINGPNGDFDPSDNVAEQQFRVSEWQFGRDRGLIDYIQPVADFNNGEWRAGPIYDILEDATVYAIDVALWDWEGFESGGPMAAFIMDPETDGIDPAGVYAMSEQISVPSTNLNTTGNAGNLIWTTLEFQEPFEVFAGDRILAVIAGFDNDFRIVGEQTTIAGGGLTYENGEWINYTNVNWAVRLNFNPNAGFIVGSGCNDINACNYDPISITNMNCVYPGCIDPSACNFEPNAGCDDGSCVPSGCNSPSACNYDPAAGCNDGSCVFTPNVSIDGTLTPSSFSSEEYSVNVISGASYDWDITGGIITSNNGSSIEVVLGEQGFGEVCVTVDNNLCAPVTECIDIVITPSSSEQGCTNETACNYNPNATINDGSCIFVGDSCDDGNPETINDEIQSDCNCSGELIQGCTDDMACNYNPNATSNDGSCIFIGDSCDDGNPETINDEIQANCECSGEIVPDDSGCTDPEACNYDPTAVQDDGSCDYVDLFSTSGNLAPELFTTEVYTYPETAGSNYQWSTALGAITAGQGSSQVTVVWGTQGTGQLCVTETREDGCIGEQVCDNVVVLPTNIEELEDEEVVVFPNPADTHVNISLSDSWIGGSFQIIDSHGRIVKQGLIDQSPMLIQTESLANGRYEINLEVNGKSINKPVMVK